MGFIESFNLDEPVSLYIHIPFCTSKCSYCAFYSKPAEPCIKRNYVKKLVGEIEYVTSKVKTGFKTAYIGGGNPGCLSVEDLGLIAESVCKKGRPEEFTVEMNPESLSPEHFVLFEKFFTRLSMGVQSFDEKALKFLGRNADLNQTLAGMQKALELKSLYSTQINFDLITCLGSFHNYMLDAKTMVEKYNPDHISLYALTLEEGTALWKKNPVLPDSDSQYEILMQLWNYLEDNGYEHYEVSNFAKEGCQSKHNKVYWNYKQYMGLGSGAASTGVNNGLYTRINGKTDIDLYIKSDNFSSYLIQTLTDTEAAEEFELMGLRCKDGLDLAVLNSQFGRKVERIPYGYNLENNRLIPTDEGFITADSAALYVDSSF